jgi:hypothetical protein
MQIEEDAARTIIEKECFSLACSKVCSVDGRRNIFCECGVIVGYFDG